MTSKYEMERDYKVGAIKGILIILVVIVHSMIVFYIFGTFLILKDETKQNRRKLNKYEGAIFSRQLSK